MQIDVGLNGDMYRKLGFTFQHCSSPSYFYVRGNTFLTRYQTQKSRLSKLLGDKYDSNKTEAENMNSVGFNKIYDCGNLVFTMDR